MSFNMDVTSQDQDCMQEIHNHNMEWTCVCTPAVAAAAAVAEAEPDLYVQ